MIKSNIKNIPKSEELKRFWRLEGFYKANSSSNWDNVSLDNGGVEEIGKGGIIYFDNTYLRFLNQRQDNDTLFYTFVRNRFYWFNENNMIKSLYQHDFEKEGIKGIQEFQLPYRFGNTKDTLIVQNNKKILYLIKKEPVLYVEYGLK